MKNYVRIIKTGKKTSPLPLSSDKEFLCLTLTRKRQKILEAKQILVLDLLYVLWWAAKGCRRASLEHLLVLLEAETTLGTVAGMHWYFSFILKPFSSTTSFSDMLNQCSGMTLFFSTR